jgi:uncharacterized protein with gpF-like domain
MMAVKESRPYWQYKTMNDAAVCEICDKMANKVYHADHPIWDEWFPLNHFGDRCYVVTLSGRQMEQRGLTEETRGIDEKPAEGWRYNPAKEKLGAWKPDLKGYPKELKEQFKKEAQVIWD